MKRTLLITELIDQHEGDFLKCKGCHLCTKIKNLSKEIPPVKKFERILKKGRDMTKSDIARLLEGGVPRKEIRKALKMYSNEFVEMMDNLGFGKRRVAEMAKITQSEYMDLKAQGYKDKEIALKKDINPSYLSTLKKGWREAETPKSNEYDDLIAQLKKQLSDKDKDLEERNEQIEKLQKHIDEKENLNAACDDIEKELASVREERDSYRSQLLETRYKLVKLDYSVENQKKILEDTKKTLERYEKENKAFREALKICL